jgi:C4-dicarboxylate-specific signal transduction histidine kinase
MDHSKEIEEAHRLKAKRVLMSSILPAAVCHAVLYHKAINFALIAQDAVDELRTIHSQDALTAGNKEALRNLEILDGVVAELWRVLKVIRALPDYNQVEEVCVNRLVHDFFTYEFPPGERKGVDISLMVQRERRLYVRANPWGLKQALRLLTENAVQAMEEASTKNLAVSVSVTDADCAIIRLKDTGPGISAELRDKLFKTAITKENKPERGWGAVIAANIIDGYDGIISIEDNSEPGATISVSLPRDIASLLVED